MRESKYAPNIPVKRAAEGGNAVRGAVQNGLLRANRTDCVIAAFVGKTENALRYQMRAYGCTRRVGTVIQVSSRVVPQVR